ncbi:hypothetical protein B0O99DRAFT_681965 [Bisporella sp. PMI_857]|nr:hypothetical protein B0O99DRAFT_669043 [Bisporella sp. PMI_857]KAH8600280.1 hypothetical protein B0O99DRAFT_681965 [Bisporella sp. PMI_857]
MAPPLLLSGIGMHRHEYTVEGRHNSGAMRSPLSRSAFSSPITQIYTPPGKYQEPTLNTRRSLSEYTSRINEHMVHFEELEPDTMSEGGRSVSESSGISAIGSAATKTIRKKRRSSRTRTTFQLAQPAPTLSAKQRLLQIRPKLLLQLQLLSPHSRPMPAIDVLPSTQVVPRLVKKFPRMFRGKGELGANDVMVVKSEEYDMPGVHRLDDLDSDEEGLSSRELIAVICQMPRDMGGSQGKAELVLKDGSVWHATPSENGRYFEFVSTDIHGCKQTARWVKSKVGLKGMEAPTASNTNEFKYTFSMMNPHTRRHPIMATITQTTLDIPDQYSSLASVSRKFPPVSPAPITPGTYDFDVDEELSRSTFLVDDDLKVLIQITGIWVALRQGICSSFRYSDLESPLSPRPSPSARAGSFPTPSDAGSPGHPDYFSSAPDSNPNSVSRTSKLRQACAKASPASSTSAHFEQKAGPKRTISAGANFMQRTTGRRASNPPGTVLSDSEGERRMLPTQHSVIDIVNGDLGSSLLTPLSLHVPGSSATTPDYLLNSLSGEFIR